MPLAKLLEEEEQRFAVVERDELWKKAELPLKQQQEHTVFSPGLREYAKGERVLA